MPVNSWRNLVESTDNPILKRGAPSDSDTLNRINQNILSDIVGLSSRLEQVERNQQLLSIYNSQQAVGIQALVSNLQTLIPAAPAGRGVADFYSTDFIAPENTSNIDYTYGQATLPILSTQSKMSSTDAQGTVWIPEDSRLRYCYSNTYTANVIPDDDQFVSSVEDYLGIGNQPETFWLGGSVSAPTYLFIKGILPQTLNTNRLANTIQFSPVPSFSSQLVNAYYRTTDNNWSSIDLSYLVGFTTSTTPNQVSFLGPTKIHFDPQEITQVCIVLKVSQFWGIQNFSVDLVEYGSTANLVLEMSSYSPTTIKSIILSGKNPAVLNRYTTSISGSKVTIALSQVQAYSSPIISACDIRW